MGPKRRENVELCIDEAPRCRATVALAHGAGAPMDSEFLEELTAGLVAQQLRVVRFEFPYMAERRTTGRKKPPNREPVLCETWLRVIEQLEAARYKKIVIGGKSMGGRIASLVADEAQVAGLVCLGYPFHPTGRPEKLRTAHLESLRTPTLILQGERDPFGNRQEVGGYHLSSAVRVHWLADGDHSFKPRKSSGRTQEQNIAEAVEATASFVESL
ncbi:MAG: alpha/beta fold hydrolase [Pirellulaceae bacterium]